MLIFCVVATSTAILISAGVAAAGTGASIGMSISGARKQKRLADEAKAAAQKAVDEAKRTMSVNYMEGLSLPMEAYELERQRIDQQAADLLSQAAEGEQRGVGAAAGRIMAARTDAEAQQRAAFASELARLDAIKRQEDARIASSLAGISLAEAEGAQMARKEAMGAAAAYNQQTAQSVLELGKLGMQVGLGFATGDIKTGGKPGGKSTINTGIDQSFKDQYPGIYGGSSIYGGSRNMFESVTVPGLQQSPSIFQPTTQQPLSILGFYNQYGRN